MFSEQAFRWIGVGGMETIWALTMVAMDSYFILMQDLSVDSVLETAVA